jgi:hypothetical protein
MWQHELIPLGHMSSARRTLTFLGSSFAITIVEHGVAFIAVAPFRLGGGRAWNIMWQKMPTGALGCVAASPIRRTIPFVGVSVEEQNTAVLAATPAWLRSCSFTFSAFIAARTGVVVTGQDEVVPLRPMGLAIRTNAATLEVIEHCLAFVAEAPFTNAT